VVVAASDADADADAALPPCMGAIAVLDEEGRRETLRALRADALRALPRGAQAPPVWVEDVPPLSWALLELVVREGERGLPVPQAIRDTGLAPRVFDAAIQPLLRGRWANLDYKMQVTGAPDDPVAASVLRFIAYPSPFGADVADYAAITRTLGAFRNQTAVCVNGVAPLWLPFAILTTA
jgi:hypothetical protein